MGFRPSDEELADLLHEVDEDGSGEIEFGKNCPGLFGHSHGILFR